MSQLTLYNAARPPPGPPELRRLRSVGRVPPPGILRRITPARNRADCGFCILHSSFCLSPMPSSSTPSKENHDPSIFFARFKETVRIYVREHSTILHAGLGGPFCPRALPIRRTGQRTRPFPPRSPPTHDHRVPDCSPS